MEQFSLEKYLENPSRKVVTRRGNPARIICTDRKHGEDELPIVFLEECLNGEFLLACTKDGRGDYHYDTQYDLFFADEEEELTEFEKELKAMVQDIERDDYLEKESFEFWRDRLLNLARKQLQPEFEKDMDKMLAETDKIVYQKGKQDALKDLPKWKKVNVFVSNEFGLATLDDDLIITCNGYQIKLSDLKALPKEE